MFIMGDIFIHQQQSGFAHFTGDLNDHFYAQTIEAEYYKLVRAKQTKCNVTWRTVTLIPWSVTPGPSKAPPPHYRLFYCTNLHKNAVDPCFFHLNLPIIILTVALLIESNN